MKFLVLTAKVFATCKAILSGGSPFDVLTALWPTNEEGKYVIQAEGIRLAFSNHGATLANFWINNTNGEEIDIVLGLDHADSYLGTKSNPFLNGFIGRYAGYISGASYEAEGTTFPLWANAHNGTSTYNGGDNGWGRRNWAVPARTENSITFVMFDRMLNGFPGMYASSLTHTVTPYEWRIAYGITPALAPGPINLSQQVFFNLDGLKSNAKNTVLNHTLHLPSAGMRFGFDEVGLSTGDLFRNEKGKEFDFWSGPRKIEDGMKQKPESHLVCVDKAILNCGYDETFLLSHKPKGNKDDSPAAILSSPLSGITMKLYTDQDALHVHTWNEKNGGLKLKKTQGEGEVPQLGAISMEFSEWPDSVNHPEWRNRQTLWDSEHIFTGFATYKFSVAGKKD